MAVWITFLAVAAFVFGGGYSLGYHAGRRYLMHTEDTVKPKRRIRMSGHGFQWIVIGLLIVGLSTLGALYARQTASQIACSNAYLSGSSTRSSEWRQKTQEVSDDFGRFQKINPTHKAAFQNHIDELFRDIRAQHRANDTLDAYQQANNPKKACPL